MIILVIAVFSIIAAFQTPRLIKAKQYRELVVFGVLFMIAFSLFIMLALGVTIPNPTKGIKAVMDSLGMRFMRME